MKIAFFIGSVDISGGTYVIYQHALHAQKAGHDVTMIVLYPYEPHQMQWHPACRELRFVPLSMLNGERFDLAVATWWKTATELHVIHADRYAYFVQSIESRFYPETDSPLRNLVDRTYDLGLPTITEATWIKSHLEERTCQSVQLVRNGIRKDLYLPRGPTAARPLGKGQLRVLVEGPMGVFFKNVGRSIKLAKASHADSVWLLTSTLMNRLWGVDRVFSRVPITDVPPIYRSCDVLVKLSYVEGMFGPPLEMFHCGGTAIVYDVTGHDEYIHHDSNAIVIQRDNEYAVVEAINKLRQEPELLQHLKSGAMATAEAWPDWNQSSSLFLDAIENIGPSPDNSTIAGLNEISMAAYVAEEQARLATLPAPKPPTAADKLSERFRILGSIRRQYGFYRETR